MRHDKDIPLLFTEFIIQSVTLKAVQFLLLRWKWTEIFYELKSIEHIFYKWSEQWTHTRKHVQTYTWRPYVHAKQPIGST